MKKRIALALTTVALASTVPAFALENQLTGFLRVRGIMAQNLNANEKNSDPDKLVDQRLRAKYTGVVNEYLKVVYFAEVDFQWGDRSYTTSRNEGGGVGGDTVNLETKNVFMEVKVPDTPLSAVIGLQGYADNWDWSFFNADMAGAKVTAKELGGVVDVTLGWFKWNEGDVKGASGRYDDAPGQSTGENDVDMYALQLGLKPMGNFKGGLDVYYINNQGPENVAVSADNPTGTVSNIGATKEALYYVGPNASYKFNPMFNLGGWFYFNGGTSDNVPVGTAKEDVDWQGWSGNVKLDVTGTGWNAFVRGIFFSSDDDWSDDKSKSVRNPFAAAGAEFLPFGRDGLAIILPDALGITYPGNQPLFAKAAYASSGSGGYGLWGAVLGGSYTPPSLPNMYLKGAFGYFACLEDQPKGTSAANTAAIEKDGKDLGYEFGLRVGYKMAKNLDLSWGGNYAVLGDFFNNGAKNFDNGKTGEDPDDAYSTYLMATLDF